MRRTKKQRRGAAVLEMSIILLVFLTLTMGMLDLGIGVYRYHVVAQAARHGARQAIVHGALANAKGPWGPGAISTSATAVGIPVVDEIRPMLIGCDLSQTQIVVDWIDGSNALNAPVRVTVTAPYTPIMLFIFTGGTIDLTASSTMPIAH